MMEYQPLDYEGQCSELTLIKGPEPQQLLYKYYLTSIPKQLQVVTSKSQIKSWTLVCQISLPGWKSFSWSHFWPAASRKWRKDFDYLELETILQIQLHLQMNNWRMPK